MFLGIDTGGTYTDAVLMNENLSKVITKAKSLTTHHRLDHGIASAIGKVLEDANLDVNNIGLVSVSTTLAANAIVEGVDKKICAVLIGMERANAISDKLREALKSVSGFAVTSYFSVRNPEHELAAKTLETKLLRVDKRPNIAGEAIFVESLITATAFGRPSF